jgi:protein-S-isoprenylcysteine O-methyltransferase Ste14
LNKSDRNSALAAAAILAFVGLGFFVMPPLMIQLSEISTWLAYGVAIVFVLAFFAIFWLRARQQRRNERSGPSR